ncbi:MAG: CDP-glycerol glycerophosphotransferase family protein [Oscillospiraceae bacterium]|nr:CDP-glycerol glycerophosphotransferase family protein [Oscillospiraceae bacterium]
MSLRKIASGLVWRLCRMLPMQNNKVVFSSYGGKGFGGNPKAVAQALLALDSDLDLVWMTRDTKAPLPKGVRPCKFGSPQAVRELSTAKVWVDDSRSGAHYKRPGQFYLQTWHGFALKHIERAAEDHLPASYIAQCKQDSAFIDLIPSNSSFMTRVYREDFWYDGEIAEFGSPRNDIFFRDNRVLSEQVRTFFGLPREQKLLLYAPTFRADGSVSAYRLDAEAALRACAQRFGGQWTALIRLHPNAAAQSAGLFPYDGRGIIDATAYPDMQELLVATNLLITDYSSSMFDYALQGKPCIQFALDIEAYKNDRNFYFALDELPFPLTRDNAALCRCIERLDPAAQRQTWERFAREQGFCEDGHAAERCAHWILSRMKGTET